MFSSTIERASAIRLPERPRGRFRKPRPLRYAATSFLKFSHYLRALRHKDAVFIWIPRTAGTSTYSVLARHGCPNLKRLDKARYRFPQRGLVTFGHMDYVGLVESGVVSRSSHKRAFKFCFVRNPFDRTVSLFWYLKKMGDLHEKLSFDLFCRMISEGAYDRIGPFNVNGLSQCNPQLKWILDSNGEPIVDFIGRFERLDEDFKKVAEVLGIDATLPVMNQTRHNKPYEDYYTAETRRLIEQAYREDLEFLNYSFSRES